MSMDAAACLKNLTGCLASMDLKLCDADKDICLKHGYCITSIVPTLKSVCICYPCYYGVTCEKEVFSKNLWSILQPSEKPQLITALKFFLLLFSVIQMINCLLSLQTFLSSYKIRITNVGIYLIFNSFVSLLYSLEELVVSILLWFIGQLPERYWRIACLIDQKFVLISLTYIWYWSIFFIAFERMLVECCHYSLFDSRKRSFIISALVLIICPLTTLPGIFTLKNLPANELTPQINSLLIPFGCVNYTPLGYTILKVVSIVHTYGVLLSYIILSAAVFIHLLRHRQRIAPDYTTQQNIRVILHNHRDFFLPLVIAIFFATPILVIDEIMTCSKALNFKALPYLTLIFGSIFGLLPMSFSFFYYIFPSNVYMIAFWRDSPVGRCLRMLKRQMVRISRQFRNILPIPARVP